MKETFIYPLICGSGRLHLFCILQRSLSGLFSTLIAFPFEQIRAGLLGLWSLSGAVGNVVAIILYMLLGFIPGIWGFLHWRKKSEPPGYHASWLSALFFL